VQVLLLEPDLWRYLGISQILATQSDITFLGDPDYRRILALKSPPAQLKPDVVIVSYSLTLDYQLTLLERLHQLFPEAQLLVDGYDESLEQMASVLRAGAKGYFQLASEPQKLLKALSIVQKGHIWAPREVVGLLIEESAEGSHHRERLQVVTPHELSILRLLQQGLPNKEIARALGIAEVTVKTHLTKLYRRFGVHTRLELLTYAMRHHILSDDHVRAPLTGPTRDM